MYQHFWFQCPAGQVLDLTTNTWVINCNLDSQILINDTPIWRDFDYYVDPSSSSLVELGSYSYPYKSIGLVFVELMNYHAHSNRTINVFLREGTINELQIAKNYIINTTLVNFKSYSTLSTSIPQKAILMMKDTNVTMFSPLTLFNILNNTFLNIDTVIYKNNIMSQNEKLILLNSDTCIFIDRSSVTFDNLVFKSSLSSINKAVYYIKPVYLQTKTLTITNVDFLVSNFLEYSI